jgi:putative oxygen-independent coproporphyrinogen III oxidase
MPVDSTPVDPRTGLLAARLGLYVHFPFCGSKCPYCDFASVALPEIPFERYTGALLAELEARLVAAEFRGPLDSVYIGGGTPSLWGPQHVERLLDAVAARLGIADGAEVTLEANPGAADEGRFAGYRAAGVNRLSIGVQSFSAATLAVLGRAHDGLSARRAARAATDAGFDNLSLDFIYGVPGQTVAEVEADALAAMALEPAHVSAYALTLDRDSLAEAVPMTRAMERGELELPPDELVLEMRRVAEQAYAEGGLLRYEVSNYARPGLHSRHNGLYWTGGEYLALGAGATGTTTAPDGQRRRYSNLRGIEAYFRAVEGGRFPEAGHEMLGRTELFEERVALGLRLVQGVDLPKVCEDFGEPYDKRRPAVDRLVAQGLAVWREGRLALTEAGMDVHSEIAAKLM